MPVLVRFLPLVPALPLAGSLLLFLFGRTLEPDPDRRSHWPRWVCSTLLALSFALAIGAVYQLQAMGGRFEWRGSAWFPLAAAQGEWGLLLDSLSAPLMLLVSGIGTLVSAYSHAYMAFHPGQSRYYGALCFFVALMQVVFLANNYLLLFAAWEGVGLASYLLIGFHYERVKAAVAAGKAFLINRLGDVGLLVGLLCISTQAHSVRYAEVRQAVALWPASVVAVTAALLLMGAIGKSAQLPLHIWLPDAMEGPTPISALIHSATMVCGGVYLIARSAFLFAAAPRVGIWITVVGLGSAMFAATLALVENDIKRVLAFSTVSQIGFMFAALGAGAYGAAMFHLVTHAFFKSLLFLGAGSVIRTLGGEQNLKHMGGLRRHMPVTFVSMWIAAAALSGIPGFAGFFSKDAILAGAAAAPHGSFLLAAGLATSVLTAAYCWRLMLLAFYGEPRREYLAVHDAPPAMTLPLLLLAAGSLASGWLPHPGTRHTGWLLPAASGLCAFGGVALAWYFYLVQPAARASLDKRFHRLTRLLRNRYYIDAIYEEHVLNRLVLGSAAAAHVCDTRLVDAGVTTLAGAARGLSRVARWADRWLVDGALRSFTAATAIASQILRRPQSGLVNHYALFFVAGLLLLLVAYFGR